MKRLLTLMLSSSAILLTLPTLTLARPPREIRSFNPGVHHSFPNQDRTDYQNYSGYCDNCGYNSPYRREYRRDYQQGYYNSDFRGRGYHSYPRYPYPEYRNGSRIRIEYEQSW